MTDLRLLGLHISVYTRIARLALEEKSINYQFDEVDIFADAGAPADYLELNPFGTIPTLLHGDLVLYETAAITRYLDEAWPGPAARWPGTRLRSRVMACRLGAWPAILPAVATRLAPACWLRRAPRAADPRYRPAWSRRSGLSATTHAPAGTTLSQRRSCIRPATRRTCAAPWTTYSTRTRTLLPLRRAAEHIHAGLWDAATCAVLATPAACAPQPAVCTTALVPLRACAEPNGQPFRALIAAQAT